MEFKREQATNFLISLRGRGKERSEETVMASILVFSFSYLLFRNPNETSLFLVQDRKFGRLGKVLTKV